MFFQNALVRLVEIRTGAAPLAELVSSSQYSYRTKRTNRGDENTHEDHRVLTGGTACVSVFTPSIGTQTTDRAISDRWCARHPAYRQNQHTYVWISGCFERVEFHVTNSRWQKQAQGELEENNQNMAVYLGVYIGLGRPSSISGKISK